MCAFAAPGVMWVCFGNKFSSTIDGVLSRLIVLSAYSEASSFQTCHAPCTLSVSPGLTNQR